MKFIDCAYSVHTVAPVPVPSISEELADIRGVEHVILEEVAPCDSTIPGDRSHSRVRVQGFEPSLWYRGELSRFSHGNTVSIIYQTIIVHGISQSWILLMDAADLSTLCMQLPHRNNFASFQTS